MGIEKEMTTNVCGNCRSHNYNSMVMLLKFDGMHERWKCNDCKHVTLHKVAGVAFTDSADESTR